MDESAVMEKPQSAVDDIDEAVVEAAQEPRISIGTVRGKVNAIVHNPLALLVIDELFGNAVKCYLDGDAYVQAREVWGELVSVSGEVHRERGTGRPIEVRSVKSIQLKAPPKPGAFLRARGAIPWRPGQEPPEVIVRRGRDDD